jgi:hypothetical protein
MRAWQRQPPRVRAVVEENGADAGDDLGVEHV